MADEKWGLKRVCADCVTPFYDMKRPKITCPKCGSLWRENAVASSSTVQLVAITRKGKAPSLENLEVDTEELRPMNANQVDDLYGDLLDEDFSSEEIKDVSAMFESNYFYRD